MTKNEIEYEDAPSGNVTFYNYKEPLMKYTKGFGFVGALVFDSESDRIQCHLCGEWFGSLPHHLKREHAMKASEYKDEVGLLQTTALISESARAKLIASGLDKRLQNLRAGGKKTQEQKTKISNTLKITAQKEEYLNLKGICPEQLIDRLQKRYKKEGDKFSTKNISFSSNLKRVYGSIKNACEIAGVPYRKPGMNRSYENRSKYNRMDMVEYMKDFYLENKRFPRKGDFIAQDKYAMYKCVNKKYKMRDIKRECIVSLPEYSYVSSKEFGEVIRYTKDDLLEFLRKFHRINGRKPSISDGKRCLIPYPSRYIYHFGSWNTALDLAFPNERI